MKAPLLLAAALLLAGCAQEPADGQEPAPAGCTLPLDDPLLGCVDPAAVDVTLRGCSTVPAFLELRQRAFELPPGFEDTPTATSPQQVWARWSSCLSGEAGGVPLGAVGFGAATVLVEGQARDPYDQAYLDYYAVELVTDSPALRSLAVALGFPVAEATVTVGEPAPGTRAATVQGDGVDYEVASQSLPVAGGTHSNGATYHSQAAWLHEEYDCASFPPTAPVEVTARAGALARAMPPAGPLVGHNMQFWQCTVTLSFGWPR